ncbi:MAG: hypothetical protein ACREFR_19810 [Limisphaerales bacterium]
MNSLFTGLQHPPKAATPLFINKDNVVEVPGWNLFTVAHGRKPSR